MDDRDLDRWSRNVDRAVKRTAKAISAALDKMQDDLPEGAFASMAIGLVVAELRRSSAVDRPAAPARSS